MCRKKIILIILSIALLICIFCGCIGCETVYEKNLKRIKETEYFRYINYEGEDTVTILEFTELGKQQEVIVIPEEIDGMKVSEIGAWKIRGALGPQPPYSLDSKNLKKLYVAGDTSFWEVEHYLIEAAIILNKQAAVAHFWVSHYYSTLIVSKSKGEIDENGIFHGAIIRGSAVYANMIFYVEGEEYWCDYITENGLYAIPPIPIENGRIFVGWFTEPEFINEWNGEYKIPEGQETLNLYAKFE